MEMSKKEDMLQFETDEKPENLKINSSTQQNKVLKIALVLSILSIFIITLLLLKIFSDFKKLKNENNSLKEEIKELKIKIDPIIKKYNKSLNAKKDFNKSVIMKENEFDFIHSTIKRRMGKSVKELRKLYQASIDGDGAKIFHSRCDYIPNTLVLIQSKGNRRFGGFTTQIWETLDGSYLKYYEDKKAFLFSLDKKKIYPNKEDGYAIFNGNDYGPCFKDIVIGSYPLHGKKMCTNENNPELYNFFGDGNALSESDGSYIYTIDYEVFQVIFE